VTIRASTAGINEDPDAHLASDCKRGHFFPHGFDQAHDLVAGDLGGREGGREGGRRGRRKDEKWRGRNLGGVFIMSTMRKTGDII